MDYVNNASNSYGSGDAMSSSLANMSIGDQQQNGVQSGHRSPGDVKMKGQSWECVCVCVWVGGGGLGSKLLCVRCGDISTDGVTH